MKNLFITIAAAITLAACSNDESAQRSADSGSIIGKWHPVSASLNGNPITVTDCEKSGTLEFFDTGSATIKNGSLTAGKCTYTTSNGTYIFENNVLTYKAGVYESKSKITDLTEEGFKSATFYLKDEFGTENIPENEQIIFSVEKVK